MDREKEPPNPDTLSDAQIVPEVKKETGFSHFIIVDNIPKVTSEKIEKLEKVLRKVFEVSGTVKKVHLPRTNKGETKGFCFVEYATADEAASALEKVNNYSLDKNHQLRTNSFEQFDSLMQVSEKFEPLPEKKFEQKENLRGWLLDPRGIDQFVLLAGDTTEVVWNEHKGPVVDVSRPVWTESFLKWSPLGTYLTTIHKRGVQIWGGPGWNRIMRFEHVEVKLIQFSPNERYLVTASTGNEASIIVWDVRTGKKIRAFPNIEAQNQWPIFKWSFDDKYLARMTEGTALFVYEASTMELLDKKSMKIEGLKEFAWSPSESLIAYSVLQPLEQDKPSTVFITEIPSKKEKATKSIVKAKNMKLFWQSSGDYLAVQVEREKKKKEVFHTLFVFRLRDKGYPSDQVELPGENFMNLFWEPKGVHFGVLYGDNLRPNVSFYSVESSPPKLEKTFEKKSINTLIWSPQGTFLVMAGLHNVSGLLEFYNVSDYEMLATEQHFMCTAVEWDPTGRFVLTSVSYWRHQLENGYNIYSFFGKLQRKVLRERLYEIYWRPRPPSLLSPEKLKEIKKNYKTYATKYKKEDETRIDTDRKKRETERQKARDSFYALLAKLDEEYKKQREERRKIPGYREDDETDFEEREEWVETQTEEDEVTVIN